MHAHTVNITQSETNTTFQLTEIREIYFFIHLFNRKNYI